MVTSIRPETRGRRRGRRQLERDGLAGDELVDAGVGVAAAGHGGR